MFFVNIGTSFAFNLNEENRCKQYLLEYFHGKKTEK